MSMYGVTKISGDDNIMLVSFKEADAALMTIILADLAKAGIVVDMISQTPPAGSTFNFSFTASYDYFDKAIAAIKAPGHAHDSHPMISGGYSKINLYGAEMVESTGVAARALMALKNENIDIAMITTSDLDISVLIRSEDADVAQKTLKTAYSL